MTSSVLPEEKGMGVPFPTVKVAPLPTTNLRRPDKASVAEVKHSNAAPSATMISDTFLNVAEPAMRMVPFDTTNRPVVSWTRFEKI